MKKHDNSRGPQMAKKDEIPIPNLSPIRIFPFPEDVVCARLTAEWTNKPHSICDLDLEVHLYDERARFVEKLDGTHQISRDSSCSLVSDVGFSHAGAFECAKIDFDKVSPIISTIALFLEGGKNFSVVNTLNLVGTKITTDRNEISFLPTVQNQSSTLFRADGRVRKEHVGICLALLYKDGWVEGRPNWVIRAVMEGFADYPKGKEEALGQLVINSVPSLEKFKPRLFSHVRDISNALSSRSLPKLKKSFQKCADGLNLGQFTQVLFNQLSQTHPKVVDELEATYAVAMIQEMFFQIDYNGDGRTDWDEFTTFCIQTGLKNTGTADMANAGKKRGTSGKDESNNLDEYVIEYGEEPLLRDRVLSSHRFVSMMKFVPENRRIFVIQEESDNVMVLNEKFKVMSQIYPSKVQILGSVQKQPSAEHDNSAATALGALRRINVYDIVFLSGRDLYAFCSSDHAIVVCKEQISMGGTKINYLQHNKVYHNMLHLKLCWSRTNNLLCSVASDKTIYGWDIDKQLPLFQISRHSDIITDFICIENLEVFVTCSMDTTIVMWSATTRRVKGLFSGHKRGVRSLSVYDNILLSSGFESEGRTWDIASKEPLGILRGHRQSIAASKLMCDRAESEKDFRAITVDESGEFRLWDIYIKEKTSEPTIYPTLQVFQMQNPEIPINNFRFIALPNNPVHSTSYYSDLVAVGTKLLHFLPEKNAKDFIAPTCCVFNDPSAAIMTAVGRNLVKYDITNGHYICTLHDIHTSDITCICLDGDRGRRVFAGCLNGDILLVNFLTGSIIDMFATHSKEIVCICSNSDKHGNRIYAGTQCGKIKEFEESAGNLRLHNQIENPFGEGVGISSVKIAPTLKVIVASAVGKHWGIWMESTLKKVFVVDENTLINAIEIIGASGDKEDLEFWDKTLNPPSARPSGEAAAAGALPDSKKVKKVEGPVDHLLTVAIAVATGIKVYTIDVRAVKGCQSFELKNHVNVYFTTISILRAPEGCVNYAMNRPTALIIGIQLIAVTDDGQIIIWDANRLRRKSEFMYRLRRHGIIKDGKEQHIMRQHFKIAQKSPQNKEISPAIQSQPPSDPLDAFTDLNLEGFNSDGYFIGFPVVPEETFSKLSSPMHRRTLLANEQAAGEANRMNAAGEKRSLSPTPLIHLSGAERKVLSPVPILQLKPIQQESEPHNDDTFLTATTATSEAAVTELDMLLQSARQRQQHQQHQSKTRQTMRHHNRRRVSKEINPICDALIRQVSRTRSWIGHLDSIPILVPLHEHGCILTVSLDGYHKVWNIEKECLGELALPNLTEKMKNPPIRVAGCMTWKFVLERIQVTQHHREVAATLLANLKTISAANNSKSHRNAIAGKIDLTGLDISNIMQDEESVSSVYTDEAGKAREKLVRSLLEPPSYLDDAPPDKILSKEERKEQSRQEQLLQLSSSISLPGLGSSHRSAVSVASLSRGDSKDVLADSQLQQNASSNISVMTDSLSSLGGLSGAASVTSPSLPGPARSKSPNEDVHYSSNASVMSSSLKSSASSLSGQSLWMTADDFCDTAAGKVSYSSNPAFSEGSLTTSWNQGFIGAEEFNILRKVSSQSDKVLVYDRSVPLVLMRNVKLTASVTLPDEKSVKRSEISFGIQKEMYKNADLYLQDKAKLPKKQILHSIAMARIHHNVRKVHSMIHVVQGRSHDEVVLPKDADIGSDEIDHDKFKEEEAKMRLRLQQSASLVPHEAYAFARPLDKTNIQSIMERFDSIVGSAGTSAEELKARALRLKKKNPVSAGIQDGLEKKLCQVIRDVQKASTKYSNSSNSNTNTVSTATTAGAAGGGGSSTVVASDLDSVGDLSVVSTINDSPVLAPKPKMRQHLTTRALLPYYKIEDVKNFMETFSKVDEDFSGDLDIDEWVKLFSLLNENVPAQQARMIFMKVDENQDGQISIRELVPIVFNKANKDQMKLIINHVEGELVKKNNSIVYMFPNEMEQLFECYDVGKIGFIPVSTIRERVKTFPMPESVLFDFLDSISSVEDDEMVNQEEFLRLMKPYIGKSKV